MLLRKTMRYLAALSAAMVISGATMAAEPVVSRSVSVSTAPQGFEEPVPMTIKTLKADAKDKALVTLHGRFVERVEKDKYTFQDVAGDTILAELDEDKNWSHIIKDKVMTVTAEVERDFGSVEIEVIQAK